MISTQYKVRNALSPKTLKSKEEIEKRVKDIITDAEYRVLEANKRVLFVEEELDKAKIRESEFMNELEDKRNQLNELKRKKNQYDSLYDEQQKLLESARKTEGEMSSLKETLQTSQENLEKANRNVQLCQEQLKKINEEKKIERGKSYIEASDESYEVSTDDLSGEALEFLQVAMNTIQENQQILQKAQDQITKLNLQIKEINFKNTESEKECSVLRESLKKLQAQEKEFLELSEKLNQCTKEKDNLSQLVTALNQEKDNLSQLVTALNQEKDNLVTAFNQVKDDLEKKDMAYNELKDNYNELKNINDDLSESIKFSKKSESLADEFNTIKLTQELEEITLEKNTLIERLKENDKLKIDGSSTNDKVEEVFIVNDKGRKFYYKVVCTLFLVFVSIPALLLSYLLNSVLQSSNLSLFKTKVEILSKIKLYNSLLFLFSVVLMIIFCMLLWFTKLELLIVVFISFLYLLLCGVYLVLYLEIKKLSSDLGQSNVYLNFMMYIIPMMLSTFLLSIGQIAIYRRYNN
jgi:chromosome segregation ATPase